MENFEGMTMLPACYLAPVDWYAAFVAMLRGAGAVGGVETGGEAPRRCAGHSGCIAGQERLDDGCGAAGLDDGCRLVRVDDGCRLVGVRWANRCRILMPDGVQTLTVPLVGESTHGLLRDVRISDHGRWRSHHWNALRTAYGKSAFFEYYADDFAPFYTKKWEFLADFNAELHEVVCRLIDIDAVHYCNTGRSAVADASQRGPVLAGDVSSKGEGPATDTSQRGQVSAEGVGRHGEVAAKEVMPYYQVFASRLGFQPHLSIVDLLFNMGPEAILKLIPPK